MPAFAGQFDWAQGLVWDVAFAAVDDDEIVRQGRLSKALVDTGATKTSISPIIAKELKLMPSGKKGVQTANGLIDVNTYDVKVGFVFARKNNAGKIFKGDVHMLDKIIRAPELPLDEGRFQALIGLDVLSHGILNLSYDGHFSFSY